VTDAKQLAAAAKAIVDSNRYMTLATADESGVPWASPVWFAAVDYREFFWVSRPEARHSRNLARAAAGGDRDLRLAGARRRRAGRVRVCRRRGGRRHRDRRGHRDLTRRSKVQGLPVWTSDQVRAEARHRLYRATTTEHYVLSPRDERIPVSLGA
jgi:hypothetical protein